jgi:hypothetical protein
MAQQPILSQGLLMIEASRLHPDTPPLVGLLWTSDKPDAETSTWHTQQSQEADIHPPGGIRTHNPNSERPQTHEYFIVVADFYKTYSRTVLYTN